MDFTDTGDATGPTYEKAYRKMTYFYPTQGQGLEKLASYTLTKVYPLPLS